MRRLVCVVLLAVAGVGCDKDQGPGAVAMTDARTFDPAVVTIDVGEAVRWTNSSPEPHTVTAYEASVPEPGAYFSSLGEPPTASRKSPEELARSMITDGLLTEGETYSVSFAIPGRYEYFCIPHEDQGMKGMIIVEG